GLSYRGYAFRGRGGGPHVLQHKAYQDLIDIVATEMRVSARGQHLEDTLPQLEYRDIKRAATKIINSDGALLTLIQAVCERRSSGFIDDTEHIQAGNTSRILGCLPLRIIEIGGNGDHRVLDLVAQRCFRVSFELA